MEFWSFVSKVTVEPLRGMEGERKLELKLDGVAEESEA